MSEKLGERLEAAANAPYDMRDLHGRADLLREAAAVLRAVEGVDKEHAETMRAAKLLAVERAEFRIRAERAEAEVLAQWRPIDTAREAMASGESVLLYSAAWSVRRLVGGWDAHEKAWRIYGFGCPASQPTHWRPLPDAPLDAAGSAEGVEGG